MRYWVTNMKNNKLIYLLLIIAFAWLIILSSIFNKDEQGQSVVINEYEVNGISTDFTKIVDEAKSSIVSINSDGVISSGFVYKNKDDKTYILSTYHGINDEHGITVYFDNGYSCQATIKGYDIFADICVLEVSMPYDAKNVDIGDANITRPGEYIICIGTPVSLDYKGSVELGMISNKLTTIQNSITFDSRNYNYYIDQLQLSIKLVNGYSGSPIINMNNEVIGIVTMNKSDDLCFALPINEAKIIADNIIDEIDYTKLQLGIKGEYINEMENYVKTNLNIPIDVFDGIYVRNVVNNSFAYSCGIRNNDIILSINKIALQDYNSLLEIVYSNEKIFEFSVLRENEEIILKGSIDD